MLTAAVCIAVVVLLAGTAATTWAIARTATVKDTAAWKRGYSEGHRHGLISGEDQRDQLQTELDDWRATAQDSVDRIYAVLAQTEQTPDGAL